MKKGNVANQREHLILLIANMLIRKKESDQEWRGCMSFFNFSTKLPGRLYSLANGGFQVRKLSQVTKIRILVVFVTGILIGG